MKPGVNNPPRTSPGRPARKPLEKRDALGLREFNFLHDTLQTLRKAYPHPNRVLHYDDLVLALLIAFFNPVARSLRGIEDASQLPGIRQRLDVDCVKRATASDALELFDPTLLDPIITALRRGVGDRDLDRQHSDLRGLLHKLKAFDGSYFPLAADVHWALHQRHGKRGKVRASVRLNLHFCVASGLPSGTRGITISGQGDASEPVAMLGDVLAGDILLGDRGVFSHDAVHAIREAKADLIFRVQSSVVCTVIAERTLTQQDHEQNILSDQTVLLTGCKNKHEPVPMRLVTIKPDDADSTRDTPGTPAPATTPRQPIRLLTSIVDDTPAWVICLAYRRRWDIELFFRWLKCCANWEHLLSETKNGVLTQFYVALIGTLLLARFTGGKPDKYGYNLMCMVTAGYGTIADALPIYAKRKREREMNLASQRRRTELKKAAALKKQS